ncbi:MAG: hypothetical protein SH850_13760 [Planctomycetaceae bacterium]|nr:hypothetical protein [Planctomycetaceae bacterium]
MEPHVIPTKTYLALERLVQALKYRILRVSTDQSGHLTHARLRDSLLHPERALQPSGVQAGTAASSEPDRHAPLPVPDPEDIAYLERRIANLRLLAIRLAKSASRETKIEEVTPEVMKACWDAILEKPELLQNALSAGESRDRA